MSLERDLLKELISYNAETGVMHWKVNKSNVKAGAIAGCKDSLGYLCVRINKKLYRNHRLIWLYMYGFWPVDQIDHINGNRSDNRLMNLRAATRSENRRNSRIRINNTSGYTGVVSLPSGRWAARGFINGKCKHLGSFELKEDAINCRKRFTEDHYGEFAVSGV